MLFTPSTTPKVAGTVAPSLSLSWEGEVFGSDFPILSPPPPPAGVTWKGVNQIGKETRAQKVQTYGAMVVREGRMKVGTRRRIPGEVSSASSTWEGDPVNERMGQPRQQLGCETGFW